MYGLIKKKIYMCLFGQIIKAKKLPAIKEAELKKLQSGLDTLKKECIKLEENYTRINSSGFEKSKKFREEKELLAPEELKLQTIVGSKKNQVSIKFKKNKLCFNIKKLYFAYL